MNGWPRDAIDRFVFSTLEARHLSPAPPAAPGTLLRRVYFDLIGLPPSPEELAGFLSDPSPGAFENQVDRLLESPRFGERWGRHWLDVARYADSNGLEQNLPYNNAWRYRDYVIEAFNQDKPFDRFIREQLAGDLLPANDDAERFNHLTATGFLVLGPKALSEPDRTKLTMDVADEQIDITTRAFLGLTVSCARCHDHKYDPIPTTDYYAMAGIFTSTATLSSNAQQGPAATRWMERPLASRAQAEAIEAHAQSLNRIVETMRTVREVPGGIRSSKLPGIVVDNESAQLTGRWKESIGSTNYVDKNYLHDANSQKGRMSARFVPVLPHTGSYEVLVSYTPFPNRADNVPVAIHTGTTNHTAAVNQKLKPRLQKAFVLLGTFEFESGTNGWVEISNTGTRGFVTVDAVQFVPIAEWKLELQRMSEEATLMAQGTGNMEASDAPVMSAQPMTLALDYYQLLSRYAELQSEAPDPAPMAMAVQEGSPADARVNIRGDVDRLGPEVPRGFLKVLARGQPWEPIPSDRSGRLDLANWIASPDNPLTARVAVNRVWGYLTGRGLVDTPDNFGFLGEPPSHPQLLDHLAGRFINEGWSLKQLIRTIVLSNTYRMSSDFNAQADAIDPDNRLLWRMNRRRLDVEALRDAILSVSGNLDLTQGGPALPVGSPIGVVEDQGLQPPPPRRSVYLSISRNNVNEMFRIFDFADPHTLAGKRHTTTAATQALFLMNSEFVLTQSRLWADRLQRDTSGDPADTIPRAYRMALGRAPTAHETERAIQFLDSFPPEKRAGDTAPEKRGALLYFCQALLGSTEFQFLD
ncbi:MAG: DUF1553 domain-containing protein [Verrucomicrobia bacterium]|nr:DUF1553 domain-containing protein [Verrucomicrobiota bacterium]